MTRAAIIAALVVAGAAVAHAEPSHRKAVPDKFAKAASEAFAEAAVADEKGDLRTALGLYEKANAISPHPSCTYNIADVQRRLDQLQAALKSYETYLALAPDAPDHKDVEATIDKLEHTPGFALVHTTPPSDPESISLKDGYVLVDGEIKLKPGAPTKVFRETGDRPSFSIELPAGNHMVEIITPLTYGFHECDIAIGQRAPCRIVAKPRIDGRVVIGADLAGLEVRTEPHTNSLVRQRFELPPGHARLVVRHHNYECHPIALDVAPGGDLTYVFLKVTEYDGVDRCPAFDVKKHNLHFEP